MCMTWHGPEQKRDHALKDQVLRIHSPLEQDGKSSFATPHNYYQLHVSTAARVSRQKNRQKTYKTNKLANNDIM